MTRSCGCSVCTRSACRGAESCLLLSALLCRVPARRPGNFHLRGQMKVTKAKALNATPFMRSARCGTPAQRATWRPCDTSNPPRTRRRGPRKASPAQIRWIPGQSAARPRRVSCRFDLRRWLQVARRAGRARRGERAERCCIQPLCFGDFHLGPQMKATRLPGRDPAKRRSQTEPLQNKPSACRKNPNSPEQLSRLGRRDARDRKPPDEPRRQLGNLRLVERFLGQQRLRSTVEHGAIGSQHAGRQVEARLHDALHRGVDALRRCRDWSVLPFQAGAPGTSSKRGGPSA